MPLLDPSVIYVSFRVRKPFLWACCAVVYAAQAVAFMTPPDDFISHQNIHDNAIALCEKIMSHPWAVKIA